MAGFMCQAAAIATTTLGAACNDLIINPCPAILEPFCNNTFSIDPYPAILDPFDLTPTSSDAVIRQALVAMQEEYAKSCPAGAVIAVTRRNPETNKFQRIMVSNGNQQFCEKDKPITDNTLFEIGSISKPFTALLLSRAVVEGKLTLDTAVNDLLPASANIPDLLVNGARITLRQLVTHTAGLPRDINATRCDDEKFLETIRIAGEEGLDQSGGFSYSNFGFIILAYVLSRSLDTMFADLQNTMTREQLNLTHTFVASIPQQTKEDHLATGYMGPFPSGYVYDDNSFCGTGAGSTVSSGNDLTQLVETIMEAYYNYYSYASFHTDDSIIQQALLQSLMPITSGVAYAWFFGQYGSEEGAIYEHSGGLPGFHSNAVFQPKTQTGVIAMSNCCYDMVGPGRSVVSMGANIASKLLLLADGTTAPPNVFQQQQQHDGHLFQFLN